MLFNSLHFLFFFVFVTVAYFVLPYRQRWALLLVASCYFYMAFVPVYIVILGGTIVIDYFAGIWIEKTQGKKRRWFLILSLIANIGVLAVFKYYNFLNDIISDILQGFSTQNSIPYLKILLPIGLSFHTFQAMSYTIEVYRGNQKAEKHFGIYSLYVMFYPQLVAGPIERPQNLLHQFRDKFDFDYDRVTSGLRLMAWGLFKKAVIADRLAEVSDLVFNNPTQYSSISIIIGVVFFSFQIYCDFSGYSDMAIGAARVMGFTLMKNFNNPYHSKSIHEFWGRWHISLSTWFKDYLYIPLGGNRVAVPRWYLNLFIVFVISGLWHGANWTFIVWGALHGFYLIFALVTKDIRSTLYEKFFLHKIPALSQFITFVLVAFAWIFFRAKDLNTAKVIISQIFANTSTDIGVYRLLQKLKISSTEFYWYFILIIFLELVQYINSKQAIQYSIKAKSPLIRWSLYFTIVGIIYYFGIYEERQFIYFQF